MNKLFDCPNCGKKHCANRSQAYPAIIVHRCDGSTLLEVAKYENGKVIPVSVMSPKKTLSEIKTHLFYIEKVQDESSLMRYGRELENNAQQKNEATNYLRKGDIWIVKRKQSGEVCYMVFVENKTIPASHYFSGKNISPVPKNDGEDILKALLSYNIISKNPFPSQYKV